MNQDGLVHGVVTKFDEDFVLDSSANNKNVTIPPAELLPFIRRYLISKAALERRSTLSLDLSETSMHTR